MDVFRARIVDVANDSMIIEITGDWEKIDGFVEVLRPYGIMEMVARAGFDDPRRIMGINRNATDERNGKLVKHLESNYRTKKQHYGKINFGGVLKMW